MKSDKIPAGDSDAIGVVRARLGDESETRQQIRTLLADGLATK
jgi:hypothetical protein